MRFMLQDKDSYIQRLQFVIERDRKDRADGVVGDINDTFSNSRVEGR